MKRSWTGKGYVASDYGFYVMEGISFRNVDLAYMCWYGNP
jgi:hypothetical protein